jgi:DNA-binding HxlR family transcriptional regulator
VGRTKPERRVHCDESLEVVFKLFGKRWTGMIVGTLLDGPARFGELASAISGITEGMLSTRLAELRGAGLVEREVLPGPPIASVYRLTGRGTALRPALDELAAWAHTHMLGSDA